MMNIFSDEYSGWNSPIIGAYLLWRFSCGYKQNHRELVSPCIILYFLAYTLLSSKKYVNEINNRKANLNSFVKKFVESDAEDIIACFSNEVEYYKKNCMKSIQIGVNIGLLFWDINQSALVPRSLKLVRGSGLMGKDAIKIGNAAEILGKWFSKEKISNIASILGVVL